MYTDSMKDTLSDLHSADKIPIHVNVKITI